MIHYSDERRVLDEKGKQVADTQYIGSFLPSIITVRPTGVGWEVKKNGQLFLSILLSKENLKKRELFFLEQLEKLEEDEKQNK